MTVLCGARRDAGGTSLDKRVGKKSVNVCIYPGKGTLLRPGQLCSPEPRETRSVQVARTTEQGLVGKERGERRGGFLCDPPKEWESKIGMGSWLTVHRTRHKAWAEVWKPGSSPYLLFLKHSVSRPMKSIQMKWWFLLSVLAAREEPLLPFFKASNVTNISVKAQIKM